MPRRRKNDRIQAAYFNWRLFKRGEVFWADGPSNSPDLGRHSLGTSDLEEARRALVQLDLAMAVKHGKADPAALKQQPKEVLPLDRGWELYRQHVQRPQVTGGGRHSTFVRYRTVFRKFIPFAKARGVSTWNQVTTMLVEQYASQLETIGRAPRTLDFEVTTLKQAAKWFVEEGYLPADFRIKIKMKPVIGTDAYCWTRSEAQAIVDYCYSSASLRYLWAILVGLAATGLRISELASLRWSDVDAEKNIISLTDESGSAPRRRKGKASPRTVKNHRSRTFPINAALKRVLDELPRTTDGLIFHSARGHVVRPNSVRRTFAEQVLSKLSSKFPDTAFETGTPKSFRHFFCSRSANSGVPERIVMQWLGHQDSAMVRHYYHLHDDESQRQMRNLKFVDVDTSGPPEDSAEAGGQSKAG